MVDIDFTVCYELNLIQENQRYLHLEDWTYSMSTPLIAHIDYITL